MVERSEGERRKVKEQWIALFGDRVSRKKRRTTKRENKSKDEEKIKVKKDN
jgi:hypothetical protein